MASRSAHVEVGGIVGGFAAATRVSDDDPDRGWEVLGGVVGGVLGGRLPDVLDPPTSPNHRALGHAVVPIGVAMKGAVGNLDPWQGEWRRRAKELARRGLVERDPTEQWWLRVFEILCRMMAGAIPGILGGYASHLAMDATTTRSLPMIGIGGN